MQEPSIKILRTENNQLFMFFYDQGEKSISFKQYDNGGWSLPKVIISDVLSFFSLCTSEDSEVLIICQNTHGDIYLCRGDKNLKWSLKPLIKNQVSESYSRFYISKDKNSLSLIYNIPSSESKIHYMMHLYFHNGKWERPDKIDTFLPFERMPYMIDQVKENHIILYYKTNENTINSREVLLSPFTRGNLNSIIQTSQNCTDISVLTLKNKIHILYTTRGMFSSQVVYKNKYDAQISPPRVLWEGPRCDGCTMFKIKSKLWIMWISGGSLYYTTSSNDGLTFENPLKFRGAFCRHPLKVQYINNYSKNDDVVLSELYVNSENENDIMIIPLLYQDFYSFNSLKNISAAASETYSQNETIEKLRNQVMQYEEQLKDLTNQLTYASKSIADKNNELSLINAQWIERFNSLKAENDLLQNKISYSQNNTNSNINVSNNNSSNNNTSITTAEISEEDNTTTESE